MGNCFSKVGYEMLANAQRDLTAEQAAARQGIRKKYFLKFKLVILYPQAEGTLRHCALQGQKVGTTGGGGDVF